MKTYRIAITDNKIYLEFEFRCQEEEIDDRWHKIEIKNLPENFLEGDWVYLDEKGDLHHIDEIAYKPIIDEYKKYQNGVFSDPSSYIDYVLAKKKWKNWLMNPVLVEDEKKYAERRGLI